VSVRAHALALILAAAPLVAAADAAVICAHKSRKTGAVAEGASLKMRTTCKRNEVAVDVVGTIGTDRLADAGVTTPKLADGAITAAKVKPGELVTGSGTLLANRLRLPDGGNADLVNVPGFGVLKITCLSGAGRTSFANGSGTGVDVQMTVIDGGPATPYLSRLSPPDGTTATFPNSGAGGIESIEWQVSFTDGGGRPHVLTAWITMGAAATDCVVTMHALVS
jgi:hypothetical protein